MWKKDRLAIVLFLAAFALVGAECTPIHNSDPDEKRLPDRADISANGLVRSYYNTATTPSKMTGIKIPEGTKFEDDELTVELDMGGAVAVTEARVRLNIQPPKSVSGGEVEMQGRLIRPDGTIGSWQNLALKTGTTIKSQVELVYTNELDGGTTSGRWKVQLRDYVDDDDGRCLFRNATLILNLGGVVGSGGTTEVATVSAAAGKFGSLPEVEGGRSTQDWGHVGTDRMLINEFTLTNAGICTGVTLSFSLKHSDSDDPLDNVQVIVIAPDGAWDTYTPDFTGGTVYELTGFFKISTGALGSSNGTTSLGNSFEFLGSPTSGVWTVGIWDSVVDSPKFEASPDSTDGTVIIPATDWSLSVTRQ
ncbi:MAG: hypothetical protein ACYTDT_08255 [Planctomycetota bacterium]|jgi:hypothetical protein